MDRKSLGTAAVEKLPRGDPKLAGEVLYLNSLLGHRRILSYSRGVGEGTIQPDGMMAKMTFYGAARLVTAMDDCFGLGASHFGWHGLTC